LPFPTAQREVAKKPDLTCLDKLANNRKS